MDFAILFAVNVLPRRSTVFSTNDPETFWLTTTNIILGLVVLACIIIVARGVVQEYRLRIRQRSSLPSKNTRAHVIPFVGTTMADGGEPIERGTRNSHEQHPAPRGSQNPSQK